LYDADEGRNAEVAREMADDLREVAREMADDLPKVMRGVTRRHAAHSSVRWK
jgi:hypothetical protein